MTQTDITIMQQKDALNAVLDVIRSINAVSVNIHRYPAGSQIIEEGIDRALEGFTEVFKVINQFTLSEAEQYLFINKVKLEERHHHLPHISTFLTNIIDRNIKAITFHKDLTKDEVGKFCKILGQTPAELLEAGSLEELFDREEIRRIEIEDKNYFGMSKSEREASISLFTEVLRSFNQGGMAGSGAQAASMQQLQEMKANQPEAFAQVLTDQLDKLTELKTERIQQVYVPTPVFVPSLEAVTDNRLFSPEFEKKIAQADSPSPSKQEDPETHRVEALNQSFEELLRAIFALDEPDIQNRLISTFLESLTRFKDITIMKLLSRLTARDQGQAELQDKVISNLEVDNKTRLIDHIIGKFENLLEGLAPDDFRFDPEELGVSNRVRETVQRSTPEDQQGGELTEKLEKAGTLSGTISEEVESELSLAKVKFNKVMARPHVELLDESLIENIGNLAVKLIELNQNNMAAELYSRVALNLQSESADDRIKALTSLSRIMETVMKTGRTTLLAEHHTRLADFLKTESDTEVFSAAFAALVMNLGSLVRSKDPHLAVKVADRIDELTKSAPTDACRQLIEQYRAKAAENEELVEGLMAEITSNDDGTFAAASKILQTLDPERIAPRILSVLKDSEEMKTRKRCVVVLGGFGSALVPILERELNTEQPWYYTRNLLCIAQAIPDERLVPLIHRHSGSETEQVMRAAVVALAEVCDPAADNALMEIFPKLDPQQKAFTLSHLGKSTSERTREFLLSHITAEGTEEEIALSLKAITSLGRLGDPDNVPMLCDLMFNGGKKGFFGKRNTQLMAAAAKALGYIDSTEAIRSLQEVSKSRSKEVADAAKASLKRLEQP